MERPQQEQIQAYVARRKYQIKTDQDVWTPEINVFLLRWQNAEAQIPQTNEKQEIPLKSN